MCKHLDMGRHKEWRREAKKQRRKRIRSKLARQQAEQLAKEEANPRHQAWLQQQEAADMALAEEEEMERQRQEQAWLEEELRCQQIFKLKQLEKAKYNEEMAKKTAELCAEIKAKEDRKRQIKEKEEEKRKEQERLEVERVQKIENFLEQGSELPAELRVASETNPSRPICPFFSKVAACRFGDHCSRNHIRPAISDTILLAGMFIHASLGAQDSHARDQQDWGLEFGEGEAQAAFLEFYEDVVTELGSIANLSRLLVCSNAELHLRGNVYVQFASERESLKVCRTLSGRWFAGRRLQPCFVTLPSWKAAVCGLQGSGRCPKGKSCNFLHVFRNPRGLLSHHLSPRTTDVRRRSLSPLQRSRRSRSPSSRSHARRSPSRRSRRSPTRTSRTRESLSPWSPGRRITPRTPSIRNQNKYKSSSRKTSRSPDQRNKSWSPVGRNSRSPNRRKSKSPRNYRSPSNRRNTSPKRYSRSPSRNRSKSPNKTKSKSPSYYRRTNERNSSKSPNRRNPRNRNPRKKRKSDSKRVMNRESLSPWSPGRRLVSSPVSSSS